MQGESERQWKKKGTRKRTTFQSIKRATKKFLGPVSERLISANPGLKFCHDILYLRPSYALLRDCVIILWFVFIEVKAQQYFVISRYMFLDKNTLLKIWLNPGLNLTKFRGTGPRKFHVAVVQNNGKEMYKKSVLHLQSSFFAN